MDNLIIQAVDLVARYLPSLGTDIGKRTVDIAEAAAARTLYESIVNRLRELGHGAVADEYARDSRSAAAEQTKSLLTGDEAFQQRIAPMLAAIHNARAGRDAYNSSTTTTGNQNVVAPGATGVVVGGHHARVSVGNKRKIAFGGIAVAAVVIFLLFARHLAHSETPAPVPSATPVASTLTTDTTLLQTPSNPIIAPTSIAPSPVSAPPSASQSPQPPAAAFSAGADGITGSSTCRQFLGSSQETQYQAAEQIALAENNGQAAGDPFIVQNAEYSCSFDLNEQMAYIMETVG